MRRLRLLVVIGVFATSFPWTASIEARGSAVFVRLNQYYVLHSHPKAPFSADGVIMAPLRVFGHLLNLQTHFTAGGRTAAVFTSAGPTARRMGLKVDSKTASVDGRQFRLPVAPLWLKRDFDMAVPLRTVAGVFSVPASWDASSGILSLRHPDLARNSAVELLEERLLQTAPTRDTDSFRPESFAIRRITVDGALRYRVEVLLKGNPAGVKGRPTIYTLAVYESGLVSFGGWNIFTSTDVGSTKDPCKTQGDLTQCVEFFDVGGSPLRYLLVRVRMFP
ncbi:MAG TPA: stalk domain-containing protein [Candidatus Binatia bacterium]|nr:stalk domain-containing protein [Candidatus Binatia bacterium]